LPVKVFAAVADTRQLPDQKYANAAPKAAMPERTTSATLGSILKSEELHAR
jgi:hypothetical protein